MSKKNQKEKPKPQAPIEKTLAEEVLDDVLDEIVAEGDSPFEVQDTLQGKRLVFHIHNTVFLYLPLPLVESLLNSYKEALDEIYSDKITVRQGKVRAPLSDFKPEVDDEGAKTYASIGLRSVLLGIPNKLEMSLWELSAEAAIMHHASIQALVAREFAKQALDVEGCDFYLAELKEHLHFMAEERRGYLLSSRENFLNKADMTKLDEWYQKLRPMWEQAKVLYKKRDVFPEWQKMLSAANDDIRLPADLLKRLPGSERHPVQLPEYLQEKVNKQGTDSRPSHLALEHAARKCGATPYQFTRSQLYTFRRAAKDAVEEIEGTQ